MTTENPITTRSNSQVVRVRRDYLIDLKEAKKERDQLRQLVGLMAADIMQMQDAFGDLRQERDRAVSAVFRLLMAGADATVLDGS